MTLGLSDSPPPTRLLRMTSPLGQLSTRPSLPRFSLPSLWGSSLKTLMQNSFLLLSFEVLRCCCWILLGVVRGRGFNVCLLNGNGVLFHTRHRGFSRSFGLSEIAQLMSYVKHLPGQWASLFFQLWVPTSGRPGPGRSAELLSRGWVLPFGKESVHMAFESSAGMSRMGPRW